MCLRGKRLLYEYCAARGVPHKRLGKIIVATDPGQADALAGVAAAARANGVDDLAPLSRGDLARLEPALEGVAGLLSPSTGILDSHAYMLSLQGEAEDHGAVVAFRTGFAAARPRGGGVEVAAETGGETVRLGARWLINAAGLHAGAVAAAIEGLPEPHRRQVHYCKGNYFGVSARVPFSHLIYPLPERDGLGVHLTLDMAGRARFGPDTEWIARLDYTLDPSRSARFYAAIRRYWPDLGDGALVPDYTGIRVKLAPRGGPATDFVIDGPEAHGVPGVVNLFGIESPGLTASLALAEAVAARVTGPGPGPRPGPSAAASA
jgi:L-2-hydroxyglutarate oxidase LhgO